MSFLKTNLRNKGTELEPDAIGGGIRNYLEGSMGSPLDHRGPRFYGGFVMWSIAETNSGVLSRTADSILASYYGVTFVSNILNGGAGFRVVPIAAYAISHEATQHIYHPTLSFGTGSVVFIVAQKFLATANIAATTSTIAVSVQTTLEDASVALKLACIGFIASTPFGPWS